MAKDEMGKTQSTDLIAILAHGLHDGTTRLPTGEFSLAGQILPFGSGKRDLTSFITKKNWNINVMFVSCYQTAPASVANPADAATYKEQFYISGGVGRISKYLITYAPLCGYRYIGGKLVPFDESLLLKYSQ